MASELLVKRLMKQASVSVLAGLLMSSAVLAEDNADDAGIDGEVSISVDDSGMVDGGPDVSIDPVDPGEWSGEEDGVSPGEPGEGDGTDGGEVDGGVIDGGEVDGGEVAIDPECADCSGIPDVTIDPMEMGEPTDDGVTVTMADGTPRGGQPNERDNSVTGGHEVSRDQGNGAGREEDFGWKRLQEVK